MHMFETIESVEFVSNRHTVALICPGSNSSGKPYTLLILINGNYICNWQLFTLEGILNGFRTIKYMTKLGPLCLVYLTCSDSISITSWVQSASFSVPLGTQAKIQIKMNYLTDLAHSVHRE